MKSFLKMLILAALMIAAAPLARADSANQISFNGSDTYQTNGQVTFGPGITSVGGTSTGIFSAFQAGNTQTTFYSFNALTTPTPILLFTTHTTDASNSTLNFYITSDSVTTGSFQGTPFASVAGNGYYAFTVNGVTTNLYGGTFLMTTQGGPNTNVTFSDTNSVTPEPSSVLLLGTGLACVAFLMIRRRRPSDLGSAIGISA